MSFIPNDSFDSLAFRIRSSDESAFSILFDEHFEHLLKKAFYYVKDQDAAKDIVQEIFFNVWRNRHHLSTTVPLKNYLERACINRALNYLRDQKKFNYAVEEDHPIYSQSFIGHTPHTELTFEELEQNIFLFIDGLPDKIKIPFILSRFEQMSYREIAAALNISEVVVEKSIMKVLKKLRAYLVMQHRGGVV